jgi:hypothetical protein
VRHSYYYMLENLSKASTKLNVFTSNSFYENEDSGWKDKMSSEGRRGHLRLIWHVPSSTGWLHGSSNLHPSSNGLTPMARATGCDKVLSGIKGQPQLSTTRVIALETFKCGSDRLHTAACHQSPCACTNLEILCVRNIRHSSSRCTHQGIVS